MMKNAEGYADSTAGLALKNIAKEKIEKKTIERGDIFYIAPYRNTGSEQRAGRPAIIVSNNENNLHSQTVEVVFLTTRPKSKLPTHVRIFSAPRNSIALCEQITTVSIEKICGYEGKATDKEMKNIEQAIAISLGLNSDGKEELVEEITAIKAKHEMLQKMYNDLLKLVMEGKE